MKQKMRTIKQRLAQQQRRLVLFTLALALFTSTLVLLQHSLAQNSSVPRRPSKSAPKSRARAQEPASFQATVKWAVSHSTSAPAASLPVKAPKLVTSYKSNWPRRIKERQTSVKLPVVDPVQQKSQGALAIAAPLGTFEGINQAGGCGNCIPPDPTGDVGPNHYVEAVNSSFAVYSKTGTVLAGPTDINALFSTLPGNPPCKQLNDGDPIVLHDQLSDRWLISQFTAGPDYHECIAISQTSDPTGAYHVYDFNVGGTSTFHDYPKLGVWPDAYYMTSNEFAGGSSFAGAGAFAFERDKMLVGQPARMVFFDLSTVNSAFGGMLPSDLDGWNLPPAGSPNYFAEIDSEINTPSLGPDALRIWEFHVNWANPANSKFGLDGQPNAILPVAPFNPPQCIRGVGTCPPQLGSPYTLDVLGDRLMFRLAYRNFGTHESLVANHSVIADARIGVRWYEVRSPGSSPTIHQQSTFAPTDTLYRWMGSIAMDNDGNIAAGYSTSSASTFPSLAYAGRLASDPLNTFGQGEAQLWAGAGAQNVGLYLPPASRWGDYTHLSIDPTDDCTFWYVNQYYGAEGTTNPGAPWRTRIGSFKFDQCTPVAPPSPTPTPSPTATASPSPSPSPSPTGTPTPDPTPAPCGSPTTYTNAASIDITDNSASSTYPSTINVTGLAGNVSKVTVGLNGLSHSFPSDIGMMLVSPGGDTFNLVLMSDACGGGDINNQNFVFDDDGLLPLSPAPTGVGCVGGTFKPSNYGPTETYPAPAPAPATNVTLAQAFNGTNPNGVWRLYLRDDVEADAGQIAGGWTLNITTDCTATPTPTPTPTPECTVDRANVALAANGASAAASSSHSSGAYPASAVINGDSIGNTWGTSTGGWNDGTRAAYPDLFEVTFAGARIINEIAVVTLQNGWQNATTAPDENTLATAEGILDFVVEYWDGSAWVAIPNGSVTGNDRARRRFTFAAITTTKIRVNITNARNNWSRLVEVEAWGCPP